MELVINPDRHRYLSFFLFKQSYDEGSSKPMLRSEKQIFANWHSKNYNGQFSSASPQLGLGR